MSSPVHQQEDSTKNTDDGSGDTTKNKSPDTVESSGNGGEVSTSGVSAVTVVPIDGGGDNLPSYSPPETTPNLPKADVSDQPCLSSKIPLESSAELEAPTELNKDVTTPGLDQKASLMEDMATKIDSIVTEFKTKHLDAVTSAEASGTSTPGEPDDEEMVLKWEDDEMDEIMENKQSIDADPQTLVGEEDLVKNLAHKEDTYDHSNEKDQNLEVELTTETESVHKGSVSTENVSEIDLDVGNTEKILEKSVDSIKDTTPKQLNSSIELPEQIEDADIETEKSDNTNQLKLQETKIKELDDELSTLDGTIVNLNKVTELSDTNKAETVSKDASNMNKTQHTPSSIASEHNEISNDINQASSNENNDQMIDEQDSDGNKQPDDTLSNNIINIDIINETDTKLIPSNDNEMEVDDSVEFTVEKPVDQLSNIAAKSSTMSLDEPIKIAQDISQISQDQNKNSDMSAMDVSINTPDHGLVELDMMIEIPTQELIACGDSDNTDPDMTNSKDDASKDSSTDTNITDLVEKIDNIIHEKIEHQEQSLQKEVESDNMETADIETPIAEKEVIPITDASETEQVKSVIRNNESPSVSSNTEEVPIKLLDITEKDHNVEEGSTEVKDDIKWDEDAEVAKENNAASSSTSTCDTENTEIEKDSVSKQVVPTITTDMSKKDSCVEPTTLTTLAGDAKHDENEKSSRSNENLSSKTIETTENIVAKDEPNIESTAIITEKQSSIADISESEENSIAKDETATKPQSQTIKITPKESEDHPKPSTSAGVQETMQVSKDAEIPSSYMAPDTSDEVPEVTDSLGLLAESSRVMEDDEEQESERDDGDDDDDFDPDDESSNQMTAEHSEDSNAQQSESDLPKEVQLVESGEKGIDSTQFGFAISNVVSGDIDKEMDVDEADEEESAVDIADEESTLLDESQASPVDVPIIESLDIEENMPDVAEKLSSELETDEKEETSDKDRATRDAEKDKGSILKDLLEKTSAAVPTLPVKSSDAPSTEQTKSPSKVKKLEISKPKHIMNYVDLEESSSEDDVQEVPKKDVTSPTLDDVTTINLPPDIDIMSSGENTSEITTKEKEIVIKGVPKPPPLKPARLNTGEVTIKTASSTESTLVLPETKVDQPKGEKSKPKFSLEVFSLDSDDEDSVPAPPPSPSPPPEPEKSLPHRCINLVCKSDNSVSYTIADSSTLAYYNAKKKRAMVCEKCAEVVVQRAHMLVEGLKSFRPLLEIELRESCQDLVEISDSDSEDEGDSIPEGSEKIGSSGVAFLEEHLASVLNETWSKYQLDGRLQEAEGALVADLDRLQKESDEINEMLKECQAATDKLRNELYATFDHERQELPAVVIMDTPGLSYSCTEVAQPVHEVRQPKRRLSVSTETPTKKFAIPLGYTPLDSDKAQKEVPKPITPPVDNSKMDDDKDVSVVTLSAEAAPPDLPPPGELSRPALRPCEQVFAMRNAFSSWVRAKVVDVLSKGSTSPAQFSMYRVRFESKTTKSPYKILPGRCLAYSEPANARMTIGTRLIALYKDENMVKRETYYSGVVAEVPNPVNNYRYLVFFDDGYVQYVSHSDTRLVSECSQVVWDEVHPYSREFVRQYLLAYPERPMVRLHTGQRLKIELKGKWWMCQVIQVDASLVQVLFEEDPTRKPEWIYRGSTRLLPLYLELQAAERTRARPLPRNRAQKQSNMPYVEYTRSDEQEASKAAARAQAQSEELRRQRAVAKKSTAPLPTPPPTTAHAATDTVSSRVVYYTPKNAVRPYKMVPHSCGPQCRRSDVLALSELRTYNPLAKPLLSGWERQIVRYKGAKEVLYRAPCGRRVRSLAELHRYLRLTGADMPVDLFDFAPHTHCLAEFVLNKCIVAKKDLSHGKENVPVPCVNYYDESLPEFCSYNTERTPTAGVPLNLDPEFLCGCDCTDDCEDKTKCACWKMTLEGARTIGIRGTNVGYVYKRLPEPLPSGIYECNSRCKCKHTCLNRVAQHPLQLKLQVFKTLNRGWGIRALNDVPKGAFLCVYAGNLLTDATANLDGLNEGDEYLAELDYIEVVEQMKEGYEEDVPKDSMLGKDGNKNDDSGSEEESSSSEEEEKTSKNEKEDGDFQPGYIPIARTQFSKRLRRRDKEKKEKEENAAVEKKKENAEDDCITISDDEEVREPSRFNAQAGMGANEFVSKYRSVRSYFGKDEACYIMDAKVQGNIGRYLNHSCSPNVFVQNVFVDTHDPRFPWVAFFALSHIRAGTELTWNYNYDVGSVPGKALYCYCGAANCRGRLL